jgi:hypothetical protein
VEILLKIIATVHAVCNALGAARMFYWQMASRLLRRRVLGVVLLVLAAPGTSSVIDEIVSYASDIECCEDDGCDDGTEPCCPCTGLHCPCCAHVNVAASLAQLLSAAMPAVQLAFGEWEVGRLAPGYRAPPFRPPLS